MLRFELYSTKVKYVQTIRYQSVIYPCLNNDVIFKVYSVASHEPCGKGIYKSTKTRQYLVS